MSARSSWTDFLVALSLANLNLLQAWRELLFASSDDLYWMPLATRADYIAALLVMLAVAAVVFLLLRLIRRLPERFFGLIFLVLVAAALVNPIDLIRRSVMGGQEVMKLTELDSAWKIALVLLLLVPPGLAMAALISGAVRRRLAPAVYGVALVFSAFALSNAAQAVWLAGTSTASATATPPVASEPAPGSPGRVVWIIFDEMDERELFSQRPAGITYPAFDQLLDEAIHFTAARPPGGDTMQAVPALWLGRPVDWSRPEGPAELSVRFEGESEPTAHPLHQLPTIFSKAKARGARTAMIGWYHPYCRLFAKLLDHCEQTHLYTTRPVQSRGLGDALGRMANSLHVFWRWTNKDLTYRRMLAAATAAVSDPRFDFVAIHLPVPHRPYNYDSARDRLTWFGVGLDYHDALTLADRFLATLRAEMIGAGLWDRTALVVSADHGRRATGSEATDRAAVGVLPLIVRTPGQRKPYSVTHPVPGQIQHDIVLALLERRNWGERELACFAEGARAPNGGPASGC